MTSRICQTSDSEQIQGRLRKRRGGADARVAFAILATVVGVLLTVAIIGRGGDPTIDESADALSLKAWGYSAEIPYSAIDSVGLRHGLDGLRGRRNGLQSGNSYAGRFAME
uniref:hypothetical protein n=1 Tax=Gemmatimonas sp. TaxID=1962908 RepID=UPI003F72AF80